MPYQVVDNDFNRANYPSLIGQVFDNPPGYATVTIIKDRNMSKTRIKTIFQAELSDGGMAIIRKLGRQWSFTRTYDSLEQPPDCYIDIGKAKAYQLMEECLKNDVLELD